MCEAEEAVPVTHGGKEGLSEATQEGELRAGRIFKKQENMYPGIQPSPGKRDDLMESTFEGTKKNTPEDVPWLVYKEDDHIQSSTTLPGISSKTRSKSKPAKTSSEGEKLKQTTTGAVPKGRAQTNKVKTKFGKQDLKYRDPMVGNDHDGQGVRDAKREVPEPRGIAVEDTSAAASLQGFDMVQHIRHEAPTRSTWSRSRRHDSEPEEPEPLDLSYDSGLDHIEQLDLRRGYLREHTQDTAKSTRGVHSNWGSLLKMDASTRGTTVFPNDRGWDEKPLIEDDWAEPSEYPEQQWVEYQDNLAQTGQKAEKIAQEYKFEERESLEQVQERRFQESEKRRLESIDSNSTRRRRILVWELCRR